MPPDNGLETESDLGKPIIYGDDDDNDKQKEIAA